MSSIAERLNWLFDHVLKQPEQRPYTHQEVEDGTTAQGYRVTTTTIWSIRHGKTANPGILTMRAIARFFGVAPSFFTRDLISEEELVQVQQEAQPTDPTLAEIMMRTSEMDEESREALLNVVRLIANREAS